ncbi:unnamed protein product [Closterium sp. Yama58-4]|nr:unnamed protein product [Closterium sp. Yama58-4]
MAKLSQRPTCFHELRTRLLKRFGRTALIFILIPGSVAIVMETFNVRVGGGRPSVDAARNSLITSPLLLEEPIRLASILEHSHYHRSVPCLTKIVGTVGGNSKTVEQLSALLEAGMTAARFDFSVNDQENHQETYENLRAAMKKTHRMCAVVYDTHGPEITIFNSSSATVTMTAGSTVVLSGDKDQPVTAHALPLACPQLAKAVKPGDEVFVGRYLFTGSETTSVWLKVEEVKGDDIVCTVTNTAELQGDFFTVHAAQVDTDMPILSKVDERHLSTWGVNCLPHVIFLSFTRNAEDVRYARKYLAQLGKLSQAFIFAKIESIQGLRKIDEILAEADGLVLGRGDLGIDLPAEKVFLMQKVAIYKANMAGKPCVISRVVDTMTDTPRPTRAEATDVANAVLDGVDAIMLGAETLRGLYPTETVSTVRLICAEAEKAYNQELYFKKAVKEATDTMSELEAMASSAVKTAEKVHAAAIVVFTSSGRMARLVAKYKPTMPVLTLVIPRLYVDKLRWTVQGEFPAHMCCLMRGLIPMMATPKTLEQSDVSTNETVLKEAILQGQRIGVLRKHDRVVVVQKLGDSVVVRPMNSLCHDTVLRERRGGTRWRAAPGWRAGFKWRAKTDWRAARILSCLLLAACHVATLVTVTLAAGSDIVDNTGPLLGRVGQLQQLLHHQLLPSASHASTHPLPSNPHGRNYVLLPEGLDQLVLSEGSNQLGRLAAGGLGGAGGGGERGREEERSAGMVDHGGIVPEGVVPDALDKHIPMSIRMSPERLQLPLEALPRAIDTSEQKNVMLAFRERFDKFGDLIRCHGPACPDFAPCGSAYPNVHACWNPLLDAPVLVPARAPLNCPKKFPLKKPRFAWQNHDKTCSHPRDFNPREPSAMQVFRLHGVMVTHKGFAFNATHRFVHQGCKRFNPFSYPPGQKVHRIKLAFDWGYTQGNNFYHFLVEAIPSFFVAAAALPNLRDVPIIAERFQWDLYDSIGRIFIGVNRTDMRALPATEGDLFHVDTLYLPMLQECGAPNKALWMELRRHHLLHPQGLPLFRPDFSYHYRPALSYQQLTHLPPDWLVVLAQRPSGKRSFTNSEEVKEAVLAAFPPERVVVFDGSLQLMQARALFRRTRLFVGGHGAALSNLIFMPVRSHLLEIRPDKCPNRCYNSLSYACSIKYYLLFSNGTCDTTVVADVPRLQRTLNSIARNLKKEDVALGRAWELA